MSEQPVLEEDRVLPSFWNDLERHDGTYIIIYSSYAHVQNILKLDYNVQVFNVEARL